MIVEGNCITWYNGKGSVDASDIFVDGFPARFYVRSHRTGALVEFHRFGPIRDGEHEISAYLYTSRTTRVNITVFND